MKEVAKATASKHAETSASDAGNDDKSNEGSSSSSTGGLNFRGFSEEEMKALDSMLAKRVGKAIEQAMPYYVKQTTQNLRELMKEEFKEFKKECGPMKEPKSDKATYRDFTACDVPRFTGVLDPIVSNRWITAVEGAFRNSGCYERKNVIYATKFLRDSAKTWWEGKVCEKGEPWAETCTWKEFKELFSAEYAPIEEIDKIREKFQSLTQTHETVNELWRTFNDMVPYCPEYLGNEKLKVDKFQRMLKDDIRDVISPFKCTTLEDLLSRARVREADLLRRKEKEAREPKRKLEFGSRDGKRTKFDHDKKGVGNKVKVACSKCGKFHLGECKRNTPGCYKCGALDHQSKDCTKPMIVCYGCNEVGHRLRECPKSKVIEAKPLRTVKNEKVEIPKPTARVYQMSVEEAKSGSDVITGIHLVNSVPARILYDSGASVSFVSYNFSKHLTSPLAKLSRPLEVEIADSKIVVVSNVYRDVEIEIDENVFQIDLIPIMLGEFDIVIGMDWLGKYNAAILCSQKIIRVVNHSGREMIIYGDKRKGELKLCSVMKARRYLSRGYHAFMAHVVDMSFEKKSIDEVPVVNEFCDVFPEDLPGIPPARQV